MLPAMWIRRPDKEERDIIDPRQQGMGSDTLPLELDQQMLGLYRGMPWPEQKDTNGCEHLSKSTLDVCL
jgi:hypothetical protein